MSDGSRLRAHRGCPGRAVRLVPFFKVDPAWRRLPVEEREAGKDAFAEVVEEWAGRMEGLRAYNVSGIRPEADFFLWQITERYDDLLELGAALNGTPLAGWLTRRTRTRDDEAVGLHRQEARPQGKVIPREAPYLVVYPFVELRPWYFLTFEERADAMREHAAVGGSSSPSRTTRRTRSASTTRSSCRRSRATSRPTSCT